MTDFACISRSCVGFFFPLCNFKSMLVKWQYVGGYESSSVAFVINKSFMAGLKCTLLTEKKVEKVSRHVLYVHWTVPVLHPSPILLIRQLWSFYCYACPDNWSHTLIFNVCDIISVTLRNPVTVPVFLLGGGSLCRHLLFFLFCFVLFACVFLLWDKISLAYRRHLRQRSRKWQTEFSCRICS